MDEMTMRSCDEIDLDPSDVMAMWDEAAPEFVSPFGFLAPTSTATAGAMSMIANPGFSGHRWGSDSADTRVLVPAAVLHR